MRPMSTALQVFCMLVQLEMRDLRQNVTHLLEDPAPQVSPDMKAIHEALSDFAASAKFACCS